MSINIDGVDIKGCTIDGTPVKEITIDGVSVWTSTQDFLIYHSQNINLIGNDAYTTVGGTGSGAVSAQQITGDGFITCKVGEGFTSKSTSQFAIGLIDRDFEKTAYNGGNIHYGFGSWGAEVNISETVFDGESDKIIYRMKNIPIATGDRLKVACENNVIKYYKNDVLLYTSDVEPKKPMRGKFGIVTVNAYLEDIQMKI